MGSKLLFTTDSGDGSVASPLLESVLSAPLGEGWTWSYRRPHRVIHRLGYPSAFRWNVCHTKNISRTGRTQAPEEPMQGLKKRVQALEKRTLRNNKNMTITRFTQQRRRRLLHQRQSKSTIFSQKKVDFTSAQSSGCDSYSKEVDFCMVWTCRVRVTHIAKCTSTVSGTPKPASVGAPFRPGGTKLSRSRFLNGVLRPAWGGIMRSGWSCGTRTLLEPMTSSEKATYFSTDAETGERARRRGGSWGAGLMTEVCCAQPRRYYSSPKLLEPDL